MDLFDATLDGYTLEIETLDDQFEKAIARYEIPYRDGAILEDMGQKARTVRIRCYFWDDGADHYTYADHIDFINHLQSKEHFELVHPKYGPMQGCVESMAVRHDDRIMAAEVDISFVEELRRLIDDVEYEDVSTAVEAAFITGQYEQLTQFADDARAQLGPEAVGILALELDPLLPASGQIPDLSLTARLWLKNIDTVVSRAEAEFAEVINPATSTVGIIDYGLNVAGRVIGSLARTVERCSILVAGGTTGPARYLDRFEQNLNALRAAIGLDSQTRTAGAQQAALTIAVRYRSDEANRQQLRRREQTTAFDLNGRYRRPEPLDPVLTINELEASLAAARRLLQAALSAQRGLTSLKTQAESLLRHVNAVKLERDKIIRLTIDNPQPLHLICHTNGLPYGYAERVLSLNPNQRTPNATRGEISIYGR